MPKRSLIAKSLLFRTKHSRTPESFSPANLNEQNLLDLIEEWLNLPDSLPMMVDGSNDCVKLRNYWRVNHTSLFIDTYSGKSGEESYVFAPGEEEEVGRIEPEQAVAGHTRVLFYVPERGEIALMFSEVCMRGTSGTRIYNEFSSHFRSNVQGIMMERRVVLESDEWLDNICAVKSIKLKKGCLPVRAAEYVGSRSGSYEIEVKPGRGERYPPETIVRMRDDPQSAIIELGLPEVARNDGTKLSATVLGNDGREKTIDLFDDDALPQFRRTLSESNEEEMSDQSFIEYCEQRALEILRRYGQL